MDLGLIIAIVGTGFGIIAVTIALFLWNRSEANADRRDLVGVLKGLETFTRENISAIREEMKDFHTRLVEIERGRK